MTIGNVAIWGVVLVASIPALRALMSVLYTVARDHDAKNYNSVFAEGPRETLLGTSAPLAGEDSPDAYGAGLLYKKNGRHNATLVRQTKVTDDNLFR